MSELKYVIAADIGGTHCTAALIDMQRRMMVPSSLSRTAIDAGANAAAIIAAWSACMLWARRESAVASVCLAMPGPFDYEKGISLMREQNKYEKLYGLNIKELLAAGLQMEPGSIFMDNDAACFLQGEVFAGAAVEHSSDTVIGITLGTGLGTAVYRNGKTTSADLWCMPFRKGMAEDWISSRWLMQRYQQATGQVISNVKDLALLAATNAAAQAIFVEFGGQLGEFLLAFIQRENPRAIVIGGNISKAHALFGAVTRKIINERYPDIQIKWSVLGEEAPLLGAAASWLATRQEQGLSSASRTIV